MSGFALKLQSLNEDKSLVRKFCQKFEKQELVVIGEELISFYETIHWPGNIRQLKSHLNKKKIFSNGKKFIYDNFDEGLILNEISTVERQNFCSLDQMKYEYCLSVFYKMGKNIKHTSNVLQISQNTLRAILKWNEKSE
jgi:transcriptional regulator of acetoin/glycerol metabolism